MAPLCSRAGVPLFANDRPDLALLARCDGIHLGRDDVPASLVRSLAPSAEHRLRIGLSTHNEADVDDALREAPDYIAVGPVFATFSKEKPSPVIGLAGLRALTSRIKRAKKDMPVVAIGGISLETAGQIGAVVDCVAVISALLPESEGPPSLDAIRDRARALHAAALGGEG